MGTFTNQSRIGLDAVRPQPVEKCLAARARRVEIERTGNEADSLVVQFGNVIDGLPNAVA